MDPNEFERCPDCSCPYVTERKEVHYFVYGEPDHLLYTQLKAECIVLSCTASGCKMSWLDYRSEEAKDNAVGSYLLSKLHDPAIREKLPQLFAPCSACKDNAHESCTPLWRTGTGAFMLCPCGPRSKTAAQHS